MSKEKALVKCENGKEYGKFANCSLKYMNYFIYTISEQFKGIFGMNQTHSLQAIFCKAADYFWLFRVHLKACKRFLKTQSF